MSETAGISLGASAVIKNPIDKIFDQLSAVAEELKLEKQEHNTRTTFSNLGGRVVALEKGKRQVTLHLPKTINDAKTKLKKSFDKRGFGYVRIKTEDQIPDAISLIKWATKQEVKKEK